MALRFSWRNVLLAAVVALLAGLLIGVFRENQSGRQAAQWDDLSVTPLVPDAPALAAVTPPDALVVIQGLTARRLVVVALDGNDTPQEVDHAVLTWPLVPSPDGTRVLYATERTVMVLDVPARRAAIVGMLDADAHLILAQWAPDGHAVAYVIQTPQQRIAYFTLPDGSLTAREMTRVPSGLPLDVAWLPEGMPVSIALGLGPVGGFEAHYQLFDPASGDSIPLPPDVTTVQPWSPWRSPDGLQQVYAASTWDEARYQGACLTGALALTGPDWLYAAIRTGLTVQTTAFALNGLYMDRPTWLRDGRIVFRGIADKVCTALDSGIYIGALGELSHALVTAEPDYVSDDSDKLLWSTSYALDAAQTQIIWTENSIESGQGRVQMMALDGAPNGGPVSTLYQTAPIASDAPPFAFRDTEMLLYVIRLP